jgi:TDG/mug DNA glycosylase family protein
VPRFTKAEFAAARDRTVRDVIADDLRVLFCGINPGLWSAAVGQHVARPGNRFWPALHASGFTPRLLRPSEQDRLLPLGLGVTNIAARATARADELTREELRDGARLLEAKVKARRPGWLAVVGVTAYRIAFETPRAQVGPQEVTIGATRIWVLPNPSGLNAHWTPPALAEAFADLRRAAGIRPGRGSRAAARSSPRTPPRHRAGAGSRARPEDR